MNIYSSESDLYTFSVPYTAKRLLNDSVRRTLDGYHSAKNGHILNGCSNILLARIESVAALALITLSAVPLIITTVITPFFLFPTVALNVLSRLPGVSSFTLAKNFTESSNDVIYRILRINWIGVRVIPLFALTASVNTVLPGLLKPQNICFDMIHSIVKPLGELLTICATVPQKGSFYGTKEEMSALTAAEEYCRTLSWKNLRKEEIVRSVISHHTYTKSI